MSNESLTDPSDVNVALSTLEPGVTAGDIPIWDGTIWDNDPLSNYTYPVNIATSNAAAFSVKATDSDTKIFNINTLTNVIDINGDLNVTGSASFTSVTNLQVENSLIQLANSNAADLVDIGFYGKYINGGTRYAGIFRDASDGIFKVVSSTVQPTTTFSTYTLQDLSVNNLSATSLSGTLSTGIQPNITALGGLTTIGTFNGVLRATSGVLAGSSTTDHLPEGTTNKYFTTALARAAVSGSSGVAYSGGVFSLDSTYSPTFASLTLSNLTASRLLATDSNKLLASTNLSSWISGTPNQITSATDGVGGVTLSLPQSIHTSATPRFSAIGLGTTAGSDNTITFAGSVSGTLTLSAGASPTTYTLTLPSSAGTSGQMLTTNGSGTSSWTTLGIQVYTGTANSGTNGGSSSGATWNIRVLNTVQSGNLDGVFTSLASNIVTFQPGTYYVVASAPAVAVSNHRVRLWNVTSNALFQLGTSEWCQNSTNGSNRSFIHHYFTTASSLQLRLDHYTQSAIATNGLGIASSQGTEVYAMIYIEKIL